MSKLRGVVAARKSILIVEDDPDLRRMFRQALTVAGFVVHEADDGTAALRQIELNSPDLVVLDLVLPTLDGFSVLAEIAGRAHTQQIPVVIVTGWDRDDLDRLDVPCILRKPVSPDQLIDAVRSCFVSGLPANGA